MTSVATGSAVRHEEHRESGSNEGESPTDEVFELLGSRRRRYAVEYLRRCEKSVDLGELAEMTAARENGVGRAEVSSAERKRTYTALQQFHLPKMEEMGFVTYDGGRGVVEPTDLLERVDGYLGEESEDEVGDDHGWGHYYGLASILALGLAGLGWIGTVPLLAVVVVTVATFGMPSAVHAASTVRREIT